MLLIGLQLLELFPRLSAWKLMLPKSIARVLGIQAYTKKEYSHTRAMALGASTFFLPCGFTQAVQLYVVTAASPFVGAVTMGAFALGTAPGLLGIGGIAAAAAAPSATIPHLNDDIISSTSSPVAASTDGVWLAGTDLRLRAVPGTLASGDTVDIQILARVKNGPGTVTFGATGLYTQAVTVNEVY